MDVIFIEDMEKYQPDVAVGGRLTQNCVVFIVFRDGNSVASDDPVTRVSGVIACAAVAWCRGVQGGAGGAGI